MYSALSLEIQPFILGDWGAWLDKEVSQLCQLFTSMEELTQGLKHFSFSKLSGGAAYVRNNQDLSIRHQWTYHQLVERDVKRLLSGLELEIMNRV